MKYEAERQHLLTILEELKRWDMLTPGGGAVSLRLADGNILLSTTALAFNRWNVSMRDFIALTPEGGIVEQTGGLGAAGTSTHLELYRLLPRAGAVVHTHAPYSLTFASLGLEIPSVINRSDPLGEIPCLRADDTAVKAAYLADPLPLHLPEGSVQRPDVAAVNLLHYQPQMKELIAPRAAELEHHGIGFTLYRHGAFTVGRQLEETCDLMMRLEESARTAYQQAALTGGTAYPNILYRPEQTLSLAGATTGP